MTIILAVFLPSLGCLIMGLLAGRSWGHVVLDSELREAWREGYEEGCSEGLRSSSSVVIRPASPAAIPAAAEPLVPLPARLPGTDTLAGMYAQLGGADLPPARVASSETLGPWQGNPSPAKWSDPSAEYLMPPSTIAEMAAYAEYQLFWTELGSLRDSARAWYAETFSTGTLPAVR